MERRTLSVICAFQVHAFHLEIVERDRLVSLRSHVQNIYTEVIPRFHVSTLLKQQLYQLYIAPERCEMYRAKSIFFSPLVDPLPDLLLLNSFLCPFHKFDCDILKILEAAYVQKCISPSIL